jgi:hypothetical protein
MMKRMKLDDDEWDDLINELVDEDMVNNPAHYKLVLPNGDEVEAIDVIHAALGSLQTVAYCRGAAIKYLMRADKKKAYAQDLRKAAWYCSHAAAILEDLSLDD